MQHNRITGGFFRCFLQGLPYYATSGSPKFMSEKGLWFS